jgi:hypothetical protein
MADEPNPPPEPIEMTRTYDLSTILATIGEKQLVIEHQAGIIARQSAVIAEFQARLGPASAEAPGERTDA